MTRIANPDLLSVSSAVSFPLPRSTFRIFSSRRFRALPLAVRERGEASYRGTSNRFRSTTAAGFAHAPDNTHTHHAPARLDSRLDRAPAHPVQVIRRDISPSHEHSSPRGSSRA